MERDLVLVTGITGYIGTHVAELLIREGKYKVRATVRSLGNKKRLEPLRQALGEEGFSQIELREADLLDKEGLSAAIKGA